MTKRQPKKIVTSALHRIVDTSPNLSSESRARYSRDLDAWIAFAGSDPNRWTPQTAQAWYQDMLDRGLKPQSANRTLSSLRYASKWLAATTSAKDFCIVRTADNTKGKTFQPLTPAEAGAMLMTCCSTETSRIETPYDHRDFTMLVVALETGMRRMSLEGMHFENFSRSPYPLVRVPIKGHGVDFYPVPLSDTAWRALTWWRNWLAKQTGVKDLRGPVFRQLERRVDVGKTIKVRFEVKPDGISNTMINKMIARRAKLASIDSERTVHPHLFRHTFASWRKQAGVSDAHIASITGHAIKSDIGALGGYFDMAALGGEARNTTPQWLAELVERISRG
jgi:site-specific recombinase XerD